MEIKRIVTDLCMIIYIVSMPMWLMELLHIDEEIYRYIVEKE